MKNKIILITFFLIIGILLKNDFISEVKASSDDISDREVFAYALRPVFVRDQLSLTASDIDTGIEKIRNCFNVFEINLSSEDFSTARGAKIIDYLKTNQFPNLRLLDLSNSLNTSYFLNEIFGENPEKFYSLLRIKLSSSSASQADITNLICKHFSGYPAFIRDMSLYDDRISSDVATLTIDGSAGLFGRGSKFVIHENEKPSRVCYRAGPGKASVAIFQLISDR